jgi:tetratricopeptide (TPR) repeat protein
MSNLSTYIYTNFEAADAALAQYAQQLETLPLAERVAYHRAAAFLHNQRQQYEQALLQLDRASAHLDIGNQPFVAAELLAFRAAVLLNQRQWGAAQTAIDQAQKLAGNTAPAGTYCLSAGIFKPAPQPPPTSHGRPARSRKTAF